MLQELLSLMPHQMGAFALWMAVVGVGLGAGLWLAGARFSRSIITLLLVSAGAMIGKLLPGRMGWSIDPMATAVGGAMVLGVSGYLLHRWWVGIGLGLVMAAWATLVTWKIAGHGIPWIWPWNDGSTSMGASDESTWSTAQLAFPFMVWMAGISGIAAAWLWPKIGESLFYSITGLSLALAMGLACAQMGRGGWIQWAPAEDWAQVTSLASLILIGAVVQWRLGMVGVNPSPSAQSDMEY